MKQSLFVLGFLAWMIIPVKALSANVVVIVPTPINPNQCSAGNCQGPNEVPTPINPNQCSAKNCQGPGEVQTPINPRQCSAGDCIGPNEVPAPIDPNPCTANDCQGPNEVPTPINPNKCSAGNCPNPIKSAMVPSQNTDPVVLNSTKNINDPADTTILPMAGEEAPPYLAFAITGTVLSCVVWRKSRNSFKGKGAR